MGRSRGGLSTKMHCLVDGWGRPLVIAVTPGHRRLAGAAADARRAAGAAGGTRAAADPTAGAAGGQGVLVPGHRAHLRARGITAVIPEPADQAGHRRRRGSKGGRPVGFDVEDDKHCNVVERAVNTVKNWRALATRYDKYALVYRGGLVLAAILSWLK